MKDYLKSYVDSINLSDLIDENGGFNKSCIVVFNKNDLIQEKTGVGDHGHIISISCKSEDGIVKLTDSITNQLKIL